MADADGPNGALRDHFVQLSPTHIEQLRCPADFEEQLRVRSDVYMSHRSIIIEVDSLYNNR
jgi:hypothetical protein